jgi:hypothetical protein
MRVDLTIEKPIKQVSKAQNSPAEKEAIKLELIPATSSPTHSPTKTSYQEN